MNWQETFDGMMTSVIGRVVAAGTALMLPVLGAGSFWLQKTIGIHLDPVEAAAFISTVVLGAAALGWKWLENRGKFEQLVLEIHKLYEAGSELNAKTLATPPDPVLSKPSK